VKLDPAGLSDAERKSYSEIPVEERLLRNGFRATPTPFGSYELVRGDDPLQVTIKGSLIGSGDPVASIEGAVARKARRITVPFTITNIRLPEE
jgi:hypothetical protein